MLCVPAIHLILCDTKCQVWHYNRNIHRAVFSSYYTAQLARPCTVLHRTLPSNQNIDRHRGCDARALYRRTTQPIPLGYWCIHARTVGLRLSRLVGERFCVRVSAHRASCCLISTFYLEKVAQVVQCIDYGLRPENVNTILGAKCFVFTTACKAPLGVATHPGPKAEAHHRLVLRIIMHGALPRRPFQNFRCFQSTGANWFLHKRGRRLDISTNRYRIYYKGQAL